MTTTQVQKRSYDQRVVEVDLSDRIGNTDTVSGTPTVATSHTRPDGIDAVTISDIDASGQTVSFRVSGGGVGTHYLEVETDLTGTPSERLQVLVPLVVTG